MKIVVLTLVVLVVLCGCAGSTAGNPPNSKSSLPTQVSIDAN